MVLVAGTLATLFFHSGERHQQTHLSPVAEAGGASTSAEARRTVAFVDVHVRAMTGEPVRRHQVVVVRDGFIERIGPIGVIEPPFARLYFATMSRESVTAIVLRSARLTGRSGPARCRGHARSLHHDLAAGEDDA